MMMLPLLRRLVPSVVRSRKWVRQDSNGFITALAAREWRRSGVTVPDAWLEVMELCRAAEGGFTFWPRGQVPKWAPPLTPDADDSSVMALELLHAGWLTRREARRVAAHGVAAHRALAVAQGPPWIRPGMFAVWQRPGISRQLVDCTAATNALALLAATDMLEVTGVAETVGAITDGVVWAAGDNFRLTSLSPFYPEPDELRRAVANAVEEGCEALVPVAALLGAPGPVDVEAAICSSPYGLVTWHSPQLQVIRVKAERMRPAGEPREPGTAPKSIAEFRARRTGPHDGGRSGVSQQQQG